MTLSFQTLWQNQASVAYYQTFIEEFRFVPETTTLASLPALLFALGAYFFALLLLKVHSFQYTLKTLTALHNLTASLLSALLLFFFLRQLWQLEKEDNDNDNSGFWNLLCDASGRHSDQGRLVFLCYLNYLFKYYELSDTFLLALKGKRLEFLHVYHHAATLLLCWNQLTAQSSAQWFVICLNLGIHVIMYAYYFLQGLGYRVWWKKYLTLLQILQFVLSLCMASFVLLQTLWYESLCWGEPSSRIFGVFILSSYLYLFAILFSNQYCGGGNSSSNDEIAATDKKKKLIFLKRNY